MRLGEAGAESSFWGSSIKSFYSAHASRSSPRKEDPAEPSIAATIAILLLLQFYARAARNTGDRIALPLSRTSLL